MNDTKQVLINLLKVGVGLEKEIQVNDNIDWNYIYKEAVAHQIHTLLYPVIKKYENKLKIDQKLITKWKNVVTVSAVRQKCLFQYLNKVLLAFQKEKIPVIALKGVILRELYPQRELRTMSDVDLLIHPEDIKKCNKLLTDMGYKIKGYDDFGQDKHVQFIHESYPLIEIHQSLANSIFKNIDIYVEHIWSNTKEIIRFGSSVRKLSVEDNIIHLCIHMLSHIRSGGFGLRQLCDLVLLIENHKIDINWEYVQKIIVDCDIEYGVKAMFVICNRLFGIAIPYMQYSSDLLDHPYIDIIISEIFSGGVYGNRNTLRFKESRLISLTNGISIKATNKTQKIQQILALFFPSSHRLGSNYAYAKRNFILLPIAWIHRLIYFIKRRDLTRNDKMGFLFHSTSTSYFERIDLLRWLGIELT